MCVRQGLKVVAVDICFLTSFFFSIMPIILKFGTTLLFNQVNGQTVKRVLKQSCTIF